MKLRSGSGRYDTSDHFVSDGVRRGLGHLSAEDDALEGGRTVRIGGRDLLNLGTASYLHLERHPALLAGAEDALRRYGTQFSASRAYLQLGLYAGRGCRGTGRQGPGPWPGPRCRRAPGAPAVPPRAAACVDPPGRRRCAPGCRPGGTAPGASGGCRAARRRRTHRCARPRRLRGPARVPSPRACPGWCASPGRRAVGRCRSPARCPSRPGRPLRGSPAARSWP